jgi:hypothetical protein
VDIKEHEFAPTQADEFRLLDLRNGPMAQEVLALGRGIRIMMSRPMASRRAPGGEANSGQETDENEGATQP